jgi:predicted nucleotidyltransferase
MSPESVQQKFTAALDALIEQVKQDRSVLAAILCGSLSHDTVWAQSDIDLALVTSDEKKGSADSIAIYADGVNVHAFLMTRTQFRAVVEGSLHNSFMHALLAKGRLLYTHDETIADLSASGCGRSADATGRSSSCVRAVMRSRRSRRRTSGSSRAAISITPPCGSCTPPRPWRRSR